MSDKIISRTSIDTFNDAKVKLPQSFKRVLQCLPDIKHKDFNKLKNSFQVRCLAKIYGTVDDDLINFDRVVGSLEAIQIQFKNCPNELKSSESYFEAQKK